MSETILPQPAPTLDSLWQEARAGLIPWSVVQEYQADQMPRCKNHSDRPMATYQGDAALCAPCYAAWIEAQREAEDA